MVFLYTILLGITATILNYALHHFLLLSAIFNEIIGQFQKHWQYKKPLFARVELKPLSFVMFVQPFYCGHMTITPEVLFVLHNHELRNWGVKCIPIENKPVGLKKAMGLYWINWEYSGRRDRMYTPRECVSSVMGCSSTSSCFLFMCSHCRQIKSTWLVMNFSANQKKGKLTDITAILC